VLAYAPTPTTVAVRIDNPAGFGDQRGYYKLFYDWPILNVTEQPGFDMKQFSKDQLDRVVLFERKNLFNDPPDLRNYGVGRQPNPQHFPYVEIASNDPQRQFYRLEHGGSAIELPALLDAKTMQPLPQVGVLSHWVFWNNQASHSPITSTGAVDVFVRPYDPASVITLTLKSVKKRYVVPTSMRITDARGDDVVDTSVFMAGERKEVTVVLDPKKNPLPWRWRLASSGDNAIEWSGADELFVAANPDDFEVILSRLEAK